MKSKNSKDHESSADFVLHTSASEFSLLLFDLILDIKTYGAVEYMVLYENDVSLWYLTKKGNKQAYQLSTKLLNDSFFERLLDDSKKLDSLLRKHRTPNLNERNILSEWKKYVKLFDEFCRTYRFYEQPFQQALEKTALEHVSEEELIKFISGPKNRQKKDSEIDAKTKNAINKLVKLGKKKLELHKSAERLVTIDWMKFIDFVAKKNYLPTQIVQSLRVNKFVKMMLEGGAVDIMAAKERLGGCVMVKRNSKWCFYSGDKYLYWKNKVKKTQGKEIIGKVAFPGIVRGKVVLHQSWTGTTIINKGDILVANMTNPQMIPYIKKAGAIVTDEGGITCHAAIISREMKKPCITGTKIATQLLKTGDTVEVDANKGVVRIIK